MHDLLVSIVQNLPAILSAFGQIVRYGEDDDERLAALETQVADLLAKLTEIMKMIETSKIERKA